ncbi:unnamed protein product [Durusdinium trenchii]|uniref:Uncharacterized protein n=1 Tax=Durusdinium trenchii TaxID=1381693 RepID=A0ABP0SY24_9DINO
MPDSKPRELLVQVLKDFYDQRLVDEGREIRLEDLAKKMGMPEKKFQKMMKKGVVPVEFSFVDAEKGLDAKTFKKDTNFLFCRDWICVFGHRRVTSKETQAALVDVAKCWKLCNPDDDVEDWLVLKM